MRGGGTATTLCNPAEGGGWSAQHSGHFTPGKDQLPTVLEDRWASGPGWIIIETNQISVICYSSVIVRLITAVRRGAIGNQLLYTVHHTAGCLLQKEVSFTLMSNCRYLRAISGLTSFSITSTGTRMWHWYAGHKIWWASPSWILTVR